jgi:replicative DNA helicase
MMELFEANEPIDLLILSDKLRKNNDLEAAGGVEYLSLLEETVPTAAAITYHSKIVREKKILRDLINSGTEIVTKSYEDTDDVNHLLDECEKSIFDIAQKKIKRSFFDLKTIVKTSFESIEVLFERKTLITGVPTGFTRFNEMTAGLQPSDLIIIAGRPSMGKTTFAIDIARHVGVVEKIPVAIFSLEMSKEQLGIKMLCSEGRVSSNKIRTGFLSKSDWPNLTTAAGKLSEAPIFIDDSPGLTALDIRARARRLYAEQNKNIGLIIIDYLQLMRGRGKIENRQLEISEITRALKELAKELNVPVVALSQLSRAVESREKKIPQLSDLRESGSIEQDADVVVFLFREEVYKHDTEDAGIAEVIIGKQRNGPIGDFKVTFIKEYPRFENYAEMGDEGIE